ncbi:MAG: Holliday junction branch migration protein RuvA [Syntrophales bacterium]|nr:Holliday junction branch migration protein RuvA [Syntrophales bacterium]MDD5533762.1 Holliday junction branch migration protein RuvA [Syntrophales bacterium]
MIATIKGFLSFKSAVDVVVDVNGVGYRIFVPLSTFYELPEVGRPVTLTIHTHVKEDAFHLFGFHTSEEKQVFQMLISVSGIGPKLALSVLSGISAGELMEAVSSGNLARLTGIPGIGRKTAERMVVELKDKMRKLVPERAAAQDYREDRIKEDAFSALVNLGYRSSAVKSAVDEVVRDAPSATLEGLLKKALKILGRNP